jgi:hypothetical protein
MALAALTPQSKDNIKTTLNVQPLRPEKAK